MMNDDGGLPVDLRRACGIGPLWGLASEDLNATLLSWPAGDGVLSMSTTIATCWWS